MPSGVIFCYGLLVWPPGKAFWCDLLLWPSGIPPPKKTATVADGTHPTGMHSCNKCILLMFEGKAR